MNTFLKAAFIALINIANAAVVYADKGAPGAPGNMILWPRPDKDSVGTTLSRPLWFTTVKGAMTEIAFPYVDRVQTKNSYLVIRASNRVVYDERFDSSLFTTRIPHSLVYESRGGSDEIHVKKTFFIHPEQDSILVKFEIQFKDSAEREIVFIHSPTAEHTSGGDEMLIESHDNRPVMFAYQKDLRGDEPQFLTPLAFQAVTWNIDASTASTGFFGVNSPLDKIESNLAIGDYTRASYGSVIGALTTKSKETDLNFTVVMSFTTESSWKEQLIKMNAHAFESDTEALIETQKTEWLNYLSTLNYDRDDVIAEASILVLKSAEDKFNRGALIAAPANPSIPWQAEATENPYEDSRLRKGDSNSGYRRVWPRDLFHKATAFTAIGDYATAIDIARWLKRVQLKGFRDGSWAQNMTTNGVPSWNALQLDQTGFPIVLIHRLVSANQVSYEEFQDTVVRAANFILSAGPNTDQERWEENGGLSPNSLAAAIEGLRSAALLEGRFGDANLSRQYWERANFWASNLKKWTLIPSGSFGENYFARLEVGHNGIWRPEIHEEIFIQNKAPGMKNKYHEDEVLDGGFLQWIIAGLVDPMDKDFTHTIEIYDRNVRRNTQFGVGYLRYNFDSYGENHIGGIWPILSAERAIAAIERNEAYEEHLKLIQNMATPTGLIAEQDTLSVRPLEWSHAAYLILKRSIEDRASYYKSDSNMDWPSQ